MIVHKKDIPARSQPGPSIPALQELSPRPHTPKDIPDEGEFILLKDGLTDDWYCAQVYQVLAAHIRVHWYTTTTPPLDNYANCDEGKRAKRLADCSFLRTWCQDHGRGAATTVPPAPAKRLKQVWWGNIPLEELDEYILCRAVGLNAAGQLSGATIEVAKKLKVPHHQGAGGPEDFISKFFQVQEPERDADYR